jgi:hypothetical protein
MSFRTIALTILISSITCLSLAGSSTYSFENGTAAEGNYNPSLFADQNTQAIGRVQLVETTNQGGDGLSSVSIALSGARSGLTNFKLWTSTDAAFDGTDVQFGSTVAADPGANVMSFSGSYFMETTFYLFLSADANSAAQGSVLAKVTGVQTNVFLNNFTPPETMSNTAVVVQNPIVNTDTRQLMPIGVDKGAGATIPVYGKHGFKYADVTPFDASFRGGIRVAVGDVNGDGVADVITGAGPGGGPHIRVFDGVQLSDGNPSTIMDFEAFAPEFRGGVYVAAGDVNGDGRADIIVGAAEESSHVRVFDGNGGALMLSFFAFDSAFRGGVRVAAGDVNGDGLAEIVTGAGPGGGPQVKVFDSTGTTTLSMFAYDAAFHGGVYVAAGDVTGDGFADIITGAGPGGGPHVKVFDGSGALSTSFFAYNPTTKTGVKVGVADPFGDRVIGSAAPTRFDALAPYLIVTTPGSKGKLPVKFFSAFKGGQELLFGGVAPFGLNFSKGLFPTP